MEKENEIKEETTKEETKKEETKENQKQEKKLKKSKQLEELTEKMKLLEEETLRAKADLINYRKRKDEETSNLLKYANADILNSLLQIIDNFERALAAGNADDSFYKGMEMILKQLLGVLEKALPYIKHIHIAEKGRALPSDGFSEYVSSALSILKDGGYDADAFLHLPFMCSGT